MLTIEPVKTLLGITDSEQDALLSLLLESVTETICNYCNVDEVPDGLTYTAYRMMADAYRAEGYGSTAGAQGAPSSITEGDTTVSFRDASSTKAYEAYAASVLKNYTAQLNRYRRMKSCRCKESNSCG